MTERLRHTSLRRRLLILLLGAVTLIWLLTALLSYFDVRHEVDELLDAHLAQSAALLIAQLDAGLEESDEREDREDRDDDGDDDGDDDDDGDEHETHELFEDFDDEHMPSLHPYSRQVVFQIWQHGRRLRLHSAHAPNTRLSSQDSGFSETRNDNDHWRVFSAWNQTGLFLIQVGERRTPRDRIIFAIARRLLEPLLIALPLLAVLIGFGVSRGLRPLTVLSREVHRRHPDNLAALELAHTPLEIAPLVGGLNRLFERVRRSLENERRFTADAAHELRTPLAAIRTQAQVAYAAAGDGERRHALQQVIAGCDRGTHLVEQLLTLARLEPGLNTPRLQRCDLYAVATTVIAELATFALDKDIELELRGEPGTLVTGATGLLAIMLRNLIDNAIRYSPRGARVMVELSTDAGAVLLTVTDQGAGLPALERDKVGQRFYRLLGSGASGSGLGLSIVKRIAGIHQTELSLTAGEQGKGLRASLRFRQRTVD